MHMLSDLQLVYMVPRNSTQIVNYKHYQISSGARASLGQESKMKCLKAKD